MYSAYPPTIEKMYCLQQVLFASMNFYLLWYFVFPSCLRSIWKFTLCNSASVFYLLVENITICSLFLEDGGPLPVFFKLPISEISEIDDHKSVTILLFFLFFQSCWLVWVIESRYEDTHWLFSLSISSVPGITWSHNSHFHNCIIIFRLKLRDGRSNCW